MGCCTSNQNIKKPGESAPFSQQSSKQPTSQSNQGKTGGPHLLEVDKIGEKQRIDTPMATDGDQKTPLKGDQANLSKASQRGLGAKLNANYQYFDISPKVIKKNKIYHISNIFPVSHPYSNPSDWQKILNNISTLPEEELVQKLLNLHNRNWIREQIKLNIQMSQQSSSSFEGLVTNRHFIQLREHFNWLIWSLAHFYFQQKTENKYGLPKFNCRKWNDGFEFKGTFIRVLPYEEAYFVQNELQALKYVQMELLELQSLIPILNAQHGHKVNDGLLKDSILPLLCGISCGGFYIYGSPVIYTQELEQTKELFKEASKVFSIPHPQGNLNLSQVQHPQLLNYSQIGQMQALHNQSNLSFSYLHNNINPDFVQDSIFKFMPILKHITTVNMIPMIDFEDYNEREDHKFENIEIKYYLMHLFQILPTLSETSASTLIVRFPCFINEEITFHQFPSNNYMEFGEIHKLLAPDASSVGGEKEIADQNKQRSKTQLKPVVAQTNQNFVVQDSNPFQKKFFTKHGWDFTLMYKSNAIAQNYENKRASMFFGQRETALKYKVIEQNLGELGQSPSQLKNASHIEELKDAHDQEQQNQMNQYISPQKHSILKRVDSIGETKIFGNVFMAGYNFKKDFKVQYSMISHSYSTNIESLFSASIDQVAKIIEQSDTIWNINSLKELLHRKGLNMRFEWAVLSKLRVCLYRELVMMHILIRTMRKIINEEIKLKSKSQVPQTNEQGQTVIDEFYQGNQMEIYKEIVTFYMNALLKKKFAKQPSVFDETLSGLFLSRMAILGIIGSLSMKKEEFIYLESKDILEDIIDAPSKNPVLFINSVQTYFNIDFKPDFLRMCRQDKYLVLSKSQPVTINDIKSITLQSHLYFSIKEYAYFMLARSITNQLKGGSPSKIANKIKTKTDKDIIKQSFQKPSTNKNESMLSQSSSRGGIGPYQAISRGQPPGSEYSSNVDHQDSKTVRANENIAGNKDSLSTIRKYENIDKEINTGSTQSFQKNTDSKKQGNQKESIIDLSNRVNKKSGFQPKDSQELVLPSILYKLKTYLSSNPLYYFDASSQTYVGDTLTVMHSTYNTPSVDIINEWVICMESLLQSVISVNGSEQVLLEAFVLQGMMIYFFERDPESLYKVLDKIRATLFKTYLCAPETIVIIQVLFGLFLEDQKEEKPVEIEKTYLTALMSIFQIYGDPRGRGNIAIPYTMLLSWKLGLLSMTEDKKLHDSEFSEEIFDACLSNLYNHRKLYKEQQLYAQSNPATFKSQSQINQFELQQQQTNHKSLINLSEFEMEIENNELAKMLFDMKKYRTRPINITIAGGMTKSNTIKMGSRKGSKQGINIQQKLPQNMLNVQEDKQSSIKSKSYIPLIKSGINSGNNELPVKTITSTNQPVVLKIESRKKDEIEISDIDLDIEDENNKNYFIEENFKNNEWYIGICPFQHWSLYRQQIASSLQSQSSGINRGSNNTNSSSQYHKQIYREILQKSIPKDLFYQWLLKFNLSQYQTTQQWNNLKIKEVVFSQNQQLVSSSSSSAILSQHNMSNQSLGSTPSSAKEKKPAHIQSYTQILGKENGGISKQDMYGIVYSWGTDSDGQLGLDVIQNPSKLSNSASLKVLYPRFLVNLRDDIIKDVCCGHSHTLAININGQVYSWGKNDMGQLGLGDKAPVEVRKPVLNKFLQNITKLSAGNEHSLAITKNGELYIWGAGGLLGLGDTRQRNMPTQLAFFSKSKIQTAVCGGLHTLVVTKDTQELYSFGSTEGGQLGLPSALLLKLCGMKKGEEPGLPVITPQKVVGMDGIELCAAGEAHSIVSNKNGQVFGWGLSNYGQLGLGFSEASFEPGSGMEQSKVLEPREIKAPALKNERIKKIICGSTFTLFQTEKGELFGCGMNDLGQLGVDTFNEDIQTLEKIKKGRHNQTSDVTIPTRVICFQGIPISLIASGEAHSLAVSGDDKNLLFAWGMYKHGQLGLGEVTRKMDPRPVQTLCNSFINKISCGSFHSVSLIGDAQTISTYTSQYYANNEQLSNPWQCDMRNLSLKTKMGSRKFNQQEDEVPDDGEGRIKNPK